MSTCKVRFADVADIPVLIDMASEYHSETRQSVIPYDRARSSRQFRSILDPPNRKICLILAEDHDKRIIGHMTGSMAEHPCVNAQIATGHDLYVRPEWRGTQAGEALFQAFKKWAQSQQADVIRIDLESGTQLNRLDAFLKRMGCEEGRGNYSMWLNAMGKVKR